jgi:MFS transporter, PAT family, solute carrier family 33 (acetyl-CoA transportor), member 1
MSVSLDNLQAPVLDPLISDDGSVSESQSLLRRPETSRDALTFTEKKSLALLGTLYLLQAVPLGFACLTTPVLLRRRLSYNVIGSFSVTEYPYSLKAAWSPLVDNVYSSALGRRKSWLVPSLFFGGLILLGLGMMQNTLFDKIAGGKTGAIFVLVTAWLTLISLCATMNIATDGWALELLSKPNVHWATTAHAFGLSSGYFISFNLFLTLSSSSKQVHRAPVLAQLEEVLSPAKFLCSWGLVFTFGAILLAAVKGEHQSSSTKAGLRQAYGVIWHIVRKPNVQTLMVVHLICSIGFQTNDSITILQLVKHGFTNSEVAGLATVSFPCELLCGAFLSMIFRHYHPLKVWRGLFPVRLFTAVIAQCCVFLIHHYGTTPWRWSLALIEYLLSKFMEIAMFIALYAFHNQVADAKYGGIYMTVLGT